jgi:hypothetical protein
VADHVPTPLSAKRVGHAADAPDVIREQCRSKICEFGRAIDQRTSECLPVADREREVVVQMVDRMAKIKGQRTLTLFLEAARKLGRDSVPHLDSCDRHA